MGRPLVSPPSALAAVAAAAAAAASGSEASAARSSCHTVSAVAMHCPGDVPGDAWASACALASWLAPLDGSRALLVAQLLESADDAALALPGVMEAVGATAMAAACAAAAPEGGTEGDQGGFGGAGEGGCPDAELLAVAASALRRSSGVGAPIPDLSAAAARALLSGHPPSSCRAQDALAVMSSAPILAGDHPLAAVRAVAWGALAWGTPGRERDGPTGPTGPGTFLACCQEACPALEAPLARLPPAELREALSDLEGTACDLLAARGRPAAGASCALVMLANRAGRLAGVGGALADPGAGAAAAKEIAAASAAGGDFFGAACALYVDMHLFARYPAVCPGASPTLLASAARLADGGAWGRPGFAGPWGLAEVACAYARLRACRSPAFAAACGCVRELLWRFAERLSGAERPRAARNAAGALAFMHAADGTEKPCAGRFTELVASSVSGDAAAAFLEAARCLGARVGDPSVGARAMAAFAGRRRPCN